MTAIFVGIAFIVGGIWGLVLFFHEFVIVLKGVVPISLFLGGIVSLISGFSSVQARRVDEKPKS